MKGRRPKPAPSGIPVLDSAGPWFCPGRMTKIGRATGWWRGLVNCLPLIGHCFPPIGLQRVRFPSSAFGGAVGPITI